LKCHSNDDPLFGLLVREEPVPPLLQDEFECLNLIVTRPGGVPADASLPVMVWIHGWVCHIHALGLQTKPGMFACFAVVQMFLAQAAHTCTTLASSCKRLLKLTMPSLSSISSMFSFLLNDNIVLKNVIQLSTRSPRFRRLRSSRRCQPSRRRIRRRQLRYVFSLQPSINHTKNPKSSSFPQGSTTNSSHSPGSDDTSLTSGETPPNSRSSAPPQAQRTSTRSSSHGRTPAPRPTSPSRRVPSSSRACCQCTPRRSSPSAHRARSYTASWPGWTSRPSRNCGAFLWRLWSRIRRA
jgi:hypothetical protein